jgi:hypothetical protein
MFLALNAWQNHNMKKVQRHCTYLLIYIDLDYVTVETKYIIL